MDSSGEVYVTGFTVSTDFPTTTGAFQTTYSGGAYSGGAFVTKLNASGTALVYSTYLGGSGSEGGSSISAIAVDSSGAAYVTGNTTSSDFPTTAGAFQTIPLGIGNAFVTKLNASGTALVYSTYLGGSGSDAGLGIALDGSGAVYVTGNTSSTDFPTTAGAFQTFSAGSGDAFVTKLNASGTALVYSTYLGGSGGDFGNAIAVDSSGAAYVTGKTTSSDFPTTGAFQTTYGGGAPNTSSAGDAFMTKLNALGTALVYSTYLGGSGSDFGNAIAVGSNGSVYVTGYTGSSNFPTTAGAFQTPRGGGVIGAFVAKFSLANTHLLWTNTNGTAAIWTVNPDGSFTSTPAYGPISGWTARSIADGTDGKTRLLWTRQDGQNAVWTVNTTDGTYTSTPGYGPYDSGHWNVAALAVGPDNRTRLQWKHSPYGQSSVWTVAPDGSFLSTPGYGPYGPWTAGALAVGADSLARLLWGDGQGTFSVWTVAGDGSFTSTPAFGPIQGWTTSAIAGGPDLDARLLLIRSDGAMAVWKVDGAGFVSSTPLYGPITNWTCHGLAVGPDALSRVLWSRSDGMSSVWTISVDGSIVSTPGYGPYSGWNTTAISAGP